MNIDKWTARVSNWKRQDAAEKPVEYHISHVHEEVSEVFGAHRLILKGTLPKRPKTKKALKGWNPYTHVWFQKDGKPEGFGIELADVILVCLYIAYVTGIDLEQMMEQKMKYNETKRAAK